MLAKIFFLGISFFTAPDQVAGGTCELFEIPKNTSESCPYTLPVFYDYTGYSPRIIWRGDIDYWTTGIQGEQQGHGRYVNHTLTREPDMDLSYYILNTWNTDNFTHEQGVRELLTNVTFECYDGTESKYYFKIPFIDKRLPEFEYDEYNFTIPSDWDLKRPITELVNITVCDNDFELGHGKTLMANTTPSSLAQVELHPPLPHEYEPVYCSRLNLYLSNPFANRNRISY